MIYRCLFEQSGHFKNAFRKYGLEAYDYDIENQFNETDYVCDLFQAIEDCYEGKPSIFDTFNNDDYLLAFFPCTRFENLIQLYFRGNANGFKDWEEQKKLQYVMRLHEELHRNYMLVCKLFQICINKGFKMVMENPYATDHYLQRYFPIKPKIIDTNRRDMGDYFNKPTQYWFVNCEPKRNFIFEGIELPEKKIIKSTKHGIERSLISEYYVDRFIRENILDETVFTK